MDLALEDMFGSSPKTVMTDVTVTRNYMTGGLKKVQPVNIVTMG